MKKFYYLFVGFFLFFVPHFCNASATEIYGSIQDDGYVNILDFPCVNSPDTYFVLRVFVSSSGVLTNIGSSSSGGGGQCVGGYWHYSGFDMGAVASEANWQGDFYIFFSQTNISMQTTLADFLANFPYYAVFTQSALYPVENWFNYYVDNMGDIPSFTLDLPGMPSLEDSCHGLKTEALCNEHSDICGWNETPNVGCHAGVLTLVPPEPSFYEECADVPVTGWFTLPAIFNVPCQFHNLIAWIFTEPPDSLHTLLTENLSYILHIFPIGYITRFIAILSETAITEPPALSYTPGTSITSTTDISGTYSFQVFDHLGVVNTIRSDTNGKSLWDVFMPFWNIIVYLSLFLVMLDRVLNFNLGDYHKPGSGKNKPEGGNPVKSKYDNLKHYTS